MSEHTFSFGDYEVEVTANHAVIRHEDGEEVQPTFYEMQCIKNQAFGGTAVVVEIFPANRDLVDGQHQRHLWEVNSESVPNLATGDQVDTRKHLQTPPDPSTMEKIWGWLMRNDNV